MTPGLEGPQGRGTMLAGNMVQTRRFIRLPEVKQRTGLSRSLIYELLAEGRFPKQVPLGSRAVGWVSDEIDAWMLERIDARHAHITET